MSPGWICSHSDSQKNQRRFVFSVDVCPGLIRELRDVCSVSASADGERTCGPWERWDPRLFVRAPCAPGARERKCPPGVGHTTFQDRSLLWPPLSDKAMKLSFFTLPKTLSLKFNSALVQRGQVFSIKPTEQISLFPEESS